MFLSFWYSQIGSSRVGDNLWCARSCSMLRLLFHELYLLKVGLVAWAFADYKKLKQPRRRRQQKPHKFAYLTMINSIFARFARAYFIFWHFADVLVLPRREMTCFAVVWATWAYDDKCSSLNYTSKFSLTWPLVKEKLSTVHTSKFSLTSFSWTSFPW